MSKYPLIIDDDEPTKELLKQESISWEEDMISQKMLNENSICFTIDWLAWMSMNKTSYFIILIQIMQMGLHSSIPSTQRKRKKLI